MIPVVPARGGAEVALGVYIYIYIYTWTLQCCSFSWPFPKTKKIWSDQFFLVTRMCRCLPHIRKALVCCVHEKSSTKCAPRSILLSTNWHLRFNNVQSCFWNILPFKQCSDPGQFTSFVKYWLNGCLLAQFPSFGVCHVIPLPTSLHRCSVPAIWLVFFCLCWSSPVCFSSVPSLALLATLFQLIVPCLVCCEERNCVWLLAIIALCVFPMFFLVFSICLLLF